MNAAWPMDFQTREATRRHFSISNLISNWDSPWQRWFVVVFYALAMAWVEAAVVFYMRLLINRVVPYQTEPLPIAGGLGFAEFVRELSTLVMLAMVGLLAGRNWRTRLAFSLLAFGVWDIAYYIWLVPLTHWPASLADWDILFLIPLPWWGPVWAPMSIAALMILFGSIVSTGDSTERPLIPGRAACGAAAIGALIALAVFMTDSMRVIFAGGGLDQLRVMLPQTFNWPAFAVAWVLLAMPVVSLARQLRARSAKQRLDCAKWIGHFTRNRECRVEPDWTAPITLPRHLIAKLLPSLEQFQLGDGGGECRLIAYNAEKFTGTSAEIRQLVELWFAEEAEHARLLGGAVDRLGGKRIQSHWSFVAFCEVRRRLGVRFELQVLTLTELVSTGYYRVLRRHCNDAAAGEVCSLILRDEAGHVAFHCDRLAAAAENHRGLIVWLWAAQFWLCGYAAATVLWISHGRCLRPLGAENQEFFREIHRNIARFIRRTLSRRRAMNWNGGVPNAAAPLWTPHSTQG